MAVIAVPRVAVFFVNVLDHFLAVVAGGQIDIDVGILLMSFRKKPLEKQLVDESGRPP